MSLARRAAGLALLFSCAPDLDSRPEDTAILKGLLELAKLDVSFLVWKAACVCICVGTYVCVNVPVCLSV